MLSCILSSRVVNNPGSNIFNFIESAMKCSSNPQEQLEFIIKYDDDDKDRLSQEDFDVRYGKDANIKIFTWSRGEGRHGIHLDHFYLFAQHSQKSRFVLIGADDFYFSRNGFVDEILNIKDRYAFVGYNTPNLGHYGNQNWESYQPIWKHNEGACLPVMSTPLLEVLQNVGWHASTDNWQTLLNILLYVNHGIVIWKAVQPFYVRNDKGTSGEVETYNNMEIDGGRNCLNRYYFSLVAQQAKNIMLNMKHEGLI